MAIALGDATILVVDPQLRLLVAAHLPAIVDRLSLRVEMSRRALAAAALDITSSIVVRHHMMDVRSALCCHILIPFQVYKTKSIATQNIIWDRECALSRNSYIATLNMLADLEYGENDVSTALGDKIRDQRKAKGYTLDKLAELSDSSKSYIWELENKNPPRPSAEKLSSIAGALGVTVDYLIGSDEQTLVEAEDTAFFRQYSGLPEETRRQIREMAKILDTKNRR